MKQPPSLSHSHQMFLSQTASIQSMTTGHSIASPLIPSPPIPVPSHLPHNIVSQPLKKAILTAHGKLWFEYVSDTRKEQVIVQNINDWRHLHKMVRELEIAEDACNDMTDDLVISGFTNLRSIVVKKDAMQNLNSLKICDCDVLESIIVEDGSGWDDGICHAPFENVKSVIITSKIEFDF